MDERADRCHLTHGHRAEEDAKEDRENVPAGEASSAVGKAAHKHSVRIDSLVRSLIVYRTSKQTPSVEAAFCEFVGDQVSAVPSRMERLEALL